jgi:hypothetical protein
LPGKTLKTEYVKINAKFTVRAALGKKKWVYTKQHHYKYLIFTIFALIGVLANKKRWNE